MKKQIWITFFRMSQHLQKTSYDFSPQLSHVHYTYIKVRTSDVCITHTSQVTLLLLDQSLGGKRELLVNPCLGLK